MGWRRVNASTYEGRDFERDREGGRIEEVLQGMRKTVWSGHQGPGRLRWIENLWSRAVDVGSKRYAEEGHHLNSTAEERHPVRNRLSHRGVGLAVEPRI